MGHWDERYEDASLDFGSGVKANFFVVGDDEERGGIIVMHRHADGEVCVGSVNFDTPLMREKFPDKPKWQVHSMDPLTISPSVLQRSGPGMTECLHGFIREGRWVGA